MTSSENSACRQSTTSKRKPSRTVRKQTSVTAKPQMRKSWEASKTKQIKAETQDNAPATNKENIATINGGETLNEEIDGYPNYDAGKCN